MKFFEKNKQQLQFEWNSAGPIDWRRIKKIFVDAYVGAYQDCDIKLLAISDQLIQLAANQNKNPLQLYFEHEYENEFSRIRDQNLHDNFRINYLTIKLHDQPIAFIVSQLNYKTGRIYIRWNIVAPGFQNSGLGKLMMDEVRKYYQVDKIELYTRTLNKGSRLFYQHYGMTETDQFCFDEPMQSGEKLNGKEIASHVRRWLCDQDFKQKIYPPIDEKVENVSAFVGYCKS
jgi:ribosomal protein S18 acetylase RimI-like enzyme